VKLLVEVICVKFISVFRELEF